MRWSIRRARAVDSATPDDAFAADRRTMVERQLKPRGIHDPRVLGAMGLNPRERFVPDDLRARAYDDDALPIEQGQSISQPYVVAWMTELLEAGPGDAVLEIGTGTGYQAAILATIGATVRSIERLPEIAAEARRRLAELGLGDKVEVIVGDGSLGDPATAPHRRIIVTAGAPSLPAPLLDQLAEGGRLVIPVGPASDQQMLVVTRGESGLAVTPVGRCAFVPLIGEAGFGAAGGADAPV
jgi:protein-L-isoaspartate(D-aspartate) O-methyltransferase